MSLGLVLDRPGGAIYIDMTDRLRWVPDTIALARKNQTVILQSFLLVLGTHLFVRQTVRRVLRKEPAEEGAVMHPTRRWVMILARLLSFLPLPHRFPLIISQAC